MNNYSLSEHLRYEKNPALANESKVSVMYCSINSIGDYIPVRFLGVTRLFLSNNYIASLDGIDQFKNLTHLSIAYNSIQDIKEFDKIYDKMILISLSVKGNFFTKNPDSNIQLIKKFPKLRNLDGFKITDATYKVIDENETVMKYLVNFFAAIETKVLKIEKISKLLRINLEFYSKLKRKLTSPEIDLVIHRAMTLCKINSINEVDEVYIRKYLNKNVNPSVHIMKKVMAKFISFDNPEEFQLSQNEKRKIYEKVFDEMMWTYESKNNHSELPSYLNYLIVKSNPELENFLVSKCQLENRQLNNLDIISYLSKNLGRMLTEYTNCPKEMFTKFQLMMFYKMSNDDNELCQAQDTISVRDSIDLTEMIKNTCIFLNNFDPESFPIFALNFDYMRTLMNIIQSKIDSYIYEYSEIKQVFAQLFEFKRRADLERKAPSSYNSEKLIKGSSKNRNISAGKKSNKGNAKKDNEIFKYNFASDSIDNWNERRGRKSSQSKSSKDSQSKSKSKSKSKSPKNMVEESNRRSEKEDMVNFMSPMDSKVVNPSEDADIIRERIEREIQSNRQKTLVNNSVNVTNYTNHPFQTKTDTISTSNKTTPYDTICRQRKANNIVPISSPINNEFFTLADSHHNTEKISTEKNITEKNTTDPNEFIQNVPYSIIDAPNQKKDTQSKEENPTFKYKPQEFSPQNPPNVQPPKTFKELKNQALAAINQVNSSIQKSEMNSALLKNTRVRFLSNISKGFETLTKLVHGSVFSVLYPRLKAISYFSIASNLLFTLEKMQARLFHKKFLIILKELQLKGKELRENKRLRWKYYFIQGLKINQKIIRHNTEYHTFMLKQRALKALHMNNQEKKRERYLDNKMLDYYYKKLIKKLFLTLKYNWKTSPKQMLKDPNMSRNEYGKQIFDFFHSNNEDAQQNEDFEAYNALLNKKGDDIINSIAETDQEKEDSFCNYENNPHAQSEKHLDNLISVLQSRYKELKNDTKKQSEELDKKNRTLYVSKSGIYSNTLRSSRSKSRSKSRGKQKRRESKKSKSKNKSRKSSARKLKRKFNATCPYCVSNIDHMKCVGEDNNPGELMVGAPVFTYNTRNFIHKKL